MAASAPAPSRAVASAWARSRSVSNGMAIICQIGIVRSARPARYSPSVAATAASVALSVASARASGSPRILATRSARPTTNPACGPPTSLSPLNVTTSEPAARRSRHRLVGEPKASRVQGCATARSSTTIAPWRWASSATSRASGASTNPCWVKFDGCTGARAARPSANGSSKSAARVRLVVPTSISRAPARRTISGMRTPPPISTSSPG